MEAHHEHKTNNLLNKHEKAVDPICGMDVEIKPTSLQYKHNGKTTISALIIALPNSRSILMQILRKQGILRQIISKQNRNLKIRSVA